MNSIKLINVKTCFVLLLAVCIISCGGGSSTESQSDSSNSTTSTTEDESMTAVNSELKKLNNIIEEQNLDYAVGITSVAGKEIAEITGEKELTKRENDSIQNILKEENEKDAASLNYIKVNGKELLPNMARLDLRDYGLTTPVKNQNPAGSCWAFGAIGTFEANYKVTNSLNIDASEQYLINCSGAGTSNGGLAFQAFRWMVEKKRNVDDEVHTPYKAKDSACSSTLPKTDFYSIEWQFVDPNQNPSAIPTVQQIKDAMCRYGVISASVYVTENFQYYKYDPLQPNKKYIFKENQALDGTNHAIVLVGWDDSKHSWLLKNSWGTNWGISCNANGEAIGFKKENSGYMWIDYNTNNVGRRAAWIRARKS